jgi:hypothetical protein
MTSPQGPPAAGPGDERRKNLTLRELLDEMIELARHLVNTRDRLNRAELEYARERMEWLAGEIWEQASRGGHLD